MTDAPAAITQPSPPEKKSTNVYCTIFSFYIISKLLIHKSSMHDINHSDGVQLISLFYYEQHC